jgi:hypothetical protein
VKSLVGIGSLCVALGAVLQSQPAVASTRVHALAELKAVIAAADAESSVYVTSSAQFSASLRVTISGTIGTSSGTQTINYDLHGTPHLVTVVLVDHVAYIRGDMTVLQNFMGLKASEARAVAGKWFKMSNNVPDYATVSNGLTVSSSVNDCNMSGAVTASSNRKVDGEPVIVLSGHSVASSLNGPSLPETIYASATGKPLPIEVTQTESG